VSTVGARPAQFTSAVPPISAAKTVGSLSNPRTIRWNSQAPAASRVNSATVAAVASATCPKSSLSSSVYPSTTSTPVFEMSPKGLGPPF